MPTSTYCNHCHRLLPDAFAPGGPCPGCESIGHAGDAWDCPLCAADPGPDQLRADQSPPHAAPSHRKGSKGRGQKMPILFPPLLAEIVYRFDKLKPEDFAKLTGAQLANVLASFSAAHQLAQREAIERLRKRGN